MRLPEGNGLIAEIMAPAGTRALWLLGSNQCPQSTAQTRKQPTAFASHGIQPDPRRDKIISASSSMALRLCAASPSRARQSSAKVVFKR